ncbi:DUF1697 domain-containing protein [Lysinibacillus capsici]|uniref:DUF1697 domain-containing protein n=1 Tax=Lysinibacillus capsici TaxID=2115968 RepID=UPI0028EA8CB8|nr:DUF1697 domain-containing protein [Lysinibacillus capsici]MED4554626.1 DUF1697 domain-containing protein [Lysinibacillus capsici]
MTKYVALLRGINVGGHNKLKMAELRDALQPLGLQNIRTYIQSGNILFESSESEEFLQQQIQETIQSTFAITSTVIIRTAEEFRSIVNNCPFSEQDLAVSQQLPKLEVPATARNWKTMMKLATMIGE